jgi:hypothetical protein
MLLRPFVRNGRPGLIGTMARTTVVVGLSRRPQAQTDPVVQLKELATLRDRGVLNEEEFAAQKALVLGEPPVLPAEPGRAPGDPGGA